jgi:glycosyltransferase involved in cell wall biosynthesis
LKILIVANGYPPTAVGGVETYTAELSRYLARQGHQVTVFCRESDFSSPDTTLTTEIVDQVKVVRVVNDFKHATSFRQTILDARMEQIFAQHIDREQPDLIHFNHLIALSARLPVIAARHHIPTVTTLHDFWTICHRVNLIDWRGRICPGPLHDVNCAACVVGGTFRQKLAQAIAKSASLVKKTLPVRFRRLLRAAIFESDDLPPALASSPEIFTERLALFTEAVLSSQRILVPSDYVRTQFASNGIPFDRIEVLPLGIEELQAVPALPRESDMLTFGAIGPLQPIKGLDIAIKAFRSVHGEQLRLKIYGRTDLFPRNHVRRVKELAETDSRVSLMGPFDPSDRSAVFATIDVLLIPSRAPETFSFVSREALALGKPVIAAQIGALPEVIHDGVNGFLFPPGEVQSLAKHITAFANDPNLIHRLTVPGPAKIINTIEHGTRMERIYQQILDKQ